MSACYAWTPEVVSSGCCHHRAVRGDSSASAVTRSVWLSVTKMISTLIAVTVCAAKNDDGMIWQDLWVDDPPSPPSPPPDLFTFDDDVLELLSRMSLEEKVGQMTQVDVTQFVSYTGQCSSSSFWEDPDNCQPELSYERLRS